MWVQSHVNFPLHVSCYFELKLKFSARVEKSYHGKGRTHRGFVA